MDKQKEKVVMITTTAGCIKTMDETRKAADTICVYVKRLCKRKHYFVELEIGVSCNRPKKGRMKTMRPNL